MGTILAFFTLLAAAWELLGVLSIFVYVLCMLLSPVVIVVLFVLIALGALAGG